MPGSLYRFQDFTYDYKPESTGSIYNSGMTRIEYRGTEKHRLKARIPMAHYFDMGANLNGNNYVTSSTITYKLVDDIYDWANRLSTSATATTTFKLTDDHLNGTNSSVAFSNGTYTATRTGVPVISTDQNTYINSWKYDLNTSTIDIEYITPTVNITYEPINYVDLVEGSFKWGSWSEPTKRQKIRNNLVINIKSRADLPFKASQAERVAMESLRETITEAEFRKYVKYGFVLVKGSSGSVYQVFRNNAHTRVWRGGKLIEEVCVRIKYDQNCPPTDNVIAFKALIENSEDEFKKLGNVYRMAKAA